MTMPFATIGIAQGMHNVQTGWAPRYLWNLRILFPLWNAFLLRRIRASYSNIVYFFKLSEVWRLTSHALHPLINLDPAPNTRDGNTIVLETLFLEYQGQRHISNILKRVLRVIWFPIRYISPLIQTRGMNIPGNHDHNSYLWFVEKPPSSGAFSVVWKKYGTWINDVSYTMSHRI